MFVNDMGLISVLLLFIYLAFTEATNHTLNHTMIINSTSTVHMISSENMTTILATRKPLFIQGQEFIHDRLHKMNRNTVIWSSIALATVTGLISIYVATKTFAARRKRQTRRYKLLSNVTTMEEPLFNEHDDEEERDDDTLFVRK